MKKAIGNRDLTSLLFFFQFNLTTETFRTVFLEIIQTFFSSSDYLFTKLFKIKVIHYLITNRISHSDSIWA